MKKLSIVTPCYNDGKDIGRLIDSIYDQDYKNIEMIVVNDGSKDSTKRELAKMQKKYPQLKVIHFTENKGACVARNEGAKIATGDYLSFLPADSKLYPGMARNWVEFLNDNPEYDFYYGGYRITDEEYNELSVYMGDEFDPYFLEVNNYIDGSFPLRKELFEKMAKKNTEYYGYEMGAWDYNIKSLQDWDFWLNAVKWCDAKGHYYADAFFETVQPHAGGLSHDSHIHWIERTNTIKKKFGIPDRKICVSGIGAKFHARNIAKLLNADYKDSVSFKPHKYDMVYMVGFMGNPAETFAYCQGLRVLHWIGSDVLNMKNMKEQADKGNEVAKQNYAKHMNFLFNNIDVHFTEYEFTQKELEAMGIQSRILPLPPKNLYSPMPLPEKFTVAMYDPYVNKTFYNPDLVKGIAKKMKRVKWKFYGDPMIQGKKDNIEHLGKLNSEEMAKMIAESSCLIRLVPHDGLPLGPIEFMTAGRQVITNTDMPYAMKPKSLKEKDVMEAVKLAMKSKLDEKAPQYYTDLCDKEKYKNTIIGLIDYEPQKYWDGRATSWHKIHFEDKDLKDAYILSSEIKELKPESILDIGCGDGKWYPELSKIAKYKGIDFSKELIDYAKETFKEGDFEVKKIEDIKDNYDVMFSFTSLLHIKPEKIKEVIENLKSHCKYLVLIEPITLDQDINTTVGVGPIRTLNPIIIQEQQNNKIISGVKSSFCHEYGKYLTIKKQISLGPRVLMVCEGLLQ